MPSVNYTDPTLDRTVRVFDNFYNFEVDVNANDYDVVLSYFKSVFDDTLAAQNFTINLFQISENTGLPVETLLSEIRGQDQIQLTSTLSYYLNNLRSNATLLGINGRVAPNFYAARNVLP